MKKFMIFPAVLILILAAFTGCGCRKQMTETLPTTMPTTRPPLVTTAPTTEATTEMTTIATEPAITTETGPTVPDGMDPDNNTTGLPSPSEGRSRNHPGRAK